jgi:hypothetical protein
VQWQQIRGNGNSLKIQDALMIRARQALDGKDIAHKFLDGVLDGGLKVKQRKRNSVAHKGKCHENGFV